MRKQIPRLPPVDEKPSTLTGEELLNYKQQLEVEGIAQDIQERKKYAKWTFILIASWIAAIFCLMLIDGFKLCNFGLSENIILAAIGGTTINILAIFIFV